MSETVPKALLLTEGSEAFKTSLFIGKVDKFFDALTKQVTQKELKPGNFFKNHILIKMIPS